MKRFTRNHNSSTLLTLILILCSIVGVWNGTYHNEHYNYELLYYTIHPGNLRMRVPWGATILYLTALVLSLTTFRMTWGRFARITWPCALLNLLEVFRFYQCETGLVSLYVTCVIIGVTTIKLVCCWFSYWQPQIDQKFAGYLVFFLFFVFVIWTSYYQDTMYHRLLLGFSDIGYYFYRLKNTVEHGAFLAYHSFLPTFYDHFCPGMALLLPIYWIAPAVTTLMVVQSIFIGLPGVLIFTIAIREKLTPWCALLLTMSYFLYPAISQLTYNYSYGFHPTSFALPFLVWSFYLLDSGNVKRAILPAFIAVSMEEHVSIYYLGLGLSMLAQKKYRLGTSLICVNALYFLGIFLVFFPWHTGGQNVHVSFWGHLGGNIPEIMMSPFTRPEIFWSLLGAGRNYHLLMMLFIPMLGLCLLSPRFIIALLPVFVFNFLRDDYQSKSIAFQYQVGVVGILYLGMVLGVARMRSGALTERSSGRCLNSLHNRLKSYPPEALLAGLAMACMYGSLYLSIYPWSKPNIGIIPPEVKLIMNARGFDAIQELVPGDATVTCDDRTRAAVMDRRLALDRQFQLDIQTEYHVYQARSWDQDPMVTINLVNQLVNSGEYDLIYQENEVFILRCNHPLPPLPANLF